LYINHSRLWRPFSKLKLETGAVYVESEHFAIWVSRKSVF